MLRFTRLYRGYSRRFNRLLYISICSFFLVFLWSLVKTVLLHDDDDFSKQKSPLIFCFVLSENNRHVSARAIIYSWGKRCDRFYFVTRLQNTSVDLMLLEYFENTTNITPTTITQYTYDVLLHLQKLDSFSSYHWFLRGSDNSYVVVPNLRRLLTQLDLRENSHSYAYVGDVEQMYEKYRFVTTGSVIIFNRHTLNSLSDINDSEDEFDLKNQQCLRTMLYDHEFVKCMKQSGIKTNSINNSLILSQNLSFYKMDEQLKVTY